MSYNICIGERTSTERDTDDERDCSRPDHAPRISRDDAPTFPNDDLTGNSNERCPAYSGWSNFVNACGLEDLFFNRQTGLMREHPGCENITADHLARVQRQLRGWPGVRPANLPPGFSGWNGEDDGKYDGILARLIWLEYWMRWALENCKNPCLSNT